MDIKVVKDFRSQLGEIRDQKLRPTCLAFAASDCHAFMRNTIDPFSVEYLFYHAVQRTAAKNRNKGVGIDVMSETLSQDGQPLESGWTYLENLSVLDLWEPPAEPGELFCGEAKILPVGITPIYESLDKDIPVLLVIYISRGFQFLSSDKILYESNRDLTVGLHAIIAVGYGDSKDGKCLLIKNSWGNLWADKGFAWIHEDYIDARLDKAAVLRTL